MCPQPWFGVSLQLVSFTWWILYKMFGGPIIKIHFSIASESSEREQNDFLINFKTLLDVTEVESCLFDLLIKLILPDYVANSFSLRFHVINNLFFFIIVIKKEIEKIDVNCFSFSLAYWSHRNSLIRFDFRYYVIYWNFWLNDFFRSTRDFSRNALNCSNGVLWLGAKHCFRFGWNRLFVFIVSMHFTVRFGSCVGVLFCSVHI